MTADTRRIGYVLVLAAAALWGLNANLSRALLDEGISPFVLAELRSAGAFICLLLVALVVNRAALACRPAALPWFALIGIPGFALVYAFNYIAIDRVEIGVAQTLSYLCPLFLLLLARVTTGARIGASWVALGLGLAGTFLVAGGLGSSSLDALGVLAGIGSALSYAIWVGGSERIGREYSPLTTLIWAFGFSTLFWFIVHPPWELPLSDLSSARILALLAGAVLAGTVLPFFAMVAALKYAPGRTIAIVAMVEVAFAALLALAIYGETLSGAQVIGATLVLSAAALAYLRRTEVASGPP